MDKPGIRVTIDLFSGRKNPEVEFTGKRLQDVVERLSPTRKMKPELLGLPPMPILGYRGLIVEQMGRPVENLPRAFRVVDGRAYGPGFAQIIADEAFEDFVCRDLPKGLPPGSVIIKEMERYRTAIDFLSKLHVKDHVVWTVVDKCKCAPVYEPSWWNVTVRQPYNNCYNYATNYRTDSFAQPGEAAGAMYTSLSCDSVKAAAVKDELVDSPGADNACPLEGHLVALVIWPGADFHWYRKGPDGLWSHKPGGTAVTNLDNSGNTIADPRAADRGPYTEFCSFMVVKHGHIKIK